MADARKAADIGLATAAARLAYFAAFHAAEALIIQRARKVAKTHSDVRAEFARLLKNEPDAAREQPACLARAYTFEQISDYAVGLDAAIAPKRADDAIEGAKRFVEFVMGLWRRPA